MQRPLTQDDLFPDGPLRRLGRHVATLAEVESTNSYLLAHAGEWGDGAVATAEFQTTGHGRQGRRWLAPRGSSILLSVLLIEPEGSPWTAHATMLGALAAAEAVEAETDCHPAVRWPNDLVLGGRKFGGVLAESTSYPSRATRGPAQRAVVVGLGLNCFQQPSHFQGELAESATSLEIECRHPIDRPALARRLLEQLDALFAPQSGPAKSWEWLREAWAARCDDLGARVTLVESSRQYTGTVLEIADNGDLLVQVDGGGRRRFGSTTTRRIG